MEKETLLDKITKALTIAGNFMMMNLMFLLAALPIVTMGQALSGLISAMRYNIRGDKWLAGFKAGYKTRFLRGTVVWCVLLLFTVIVFLDITTYAAVEVFTTEIVVRLVMSCLMFALVSGLTVAFLLLNVYIPTATSEWIRNSVNMLFKAPLQVMVSGVLVWLPVLLAFFYYSIFYYCIMIFVVAYFTLAILVITMLMKDTLIYYLLEARSAGTLLKTDGDDEEENNGED